ncbi:hypothetical protein Tco_0392605 [Tanacetum coccineum]
MDDAGEDVARVDNQPQDTSQPKKDKTPEWFKQPLRPPTLDPEWNKRQVVLDQPEQPWFNQMVSASNDPLTFNDLMATLIDFSKFVLNGLKINNLTQDILLGPAYNLLKGTCTSSIELEYNFQECFNALTEKLDWNNPKGDRYPFDLSKPLPLQEHQEHQSDTKVFTMTMEILPETTSNKFCDAPILRMASVAAKPYQEDSSEFYLITGSIYTNQQGTVVIAITYATLIPHVFLENDKVLKLKNFKKDRFTSFQDKERDEHVVPEVTKSQDGNITRWRKDIMLG